MPGNADREHERNARRRFRPPRYALDLQFRSRDELLPIRSQEM
jgi:hypothetical protein